MPFDANKPFICETHTLFLPVCVWKVAGRRCSCHLTHTKWNSIAFNEFNAENESEKRKKGRRNRKNASCIHGLTKRHFFVFSNIFSPRESERRKESEKCARALQSLHITQTTACRHHSAINSLYVSFCARLFSLSLSRRCCQFFRFVIFWAMFETFFFRYSLLSFRAISFSLFFPQSFLLAVSVFCIRSNWAKRKQYETTGPWHYLKTSTGDYLFSRFIT